MKKDLRRLGAVLVAMVMMFACFTLMALADDETESTGLTAGAIVGICVGAVVLVAAVVLGYKYREKLKKFFIVMKSEMKKVTWLSWEQTKKSTLVVLAVMLVCAVVIVLLDLLLSNGFVEILELIKG